MPKIIFIIIFSFLIINNANAQYVVIGPQSVTQNKTTDLWKNLKSSVYVVYPQHLIKDTNALRKQYSPLLFKLLFNDDLYHKVSNGAVLIFDGKFNVAFQYENCTQLFKNIDTLNDWITNSKEKFELGFFTKTGKDIKVVYDFELNYLTLYSKDTTIEFDTERIDINKLQACLDSKNKQLFTKARTNIDDAFLIQQMEIIGFDADKSDNVNVAVKYVNYKNDTEEALYGFVCIVKLNNQGEILNYYPMDDFSFSFSKDDCLVSGDSVVYLRKSTNIENDRYVGKFVKKNNAYIFQGFISIDLNKLNKLYFKGNFLDFSLADGRYYCSNLSNIIYDVHSKNYNYIITDSVYQLILDIYATNTNAKENYDKLFFVNQIYKDVANDKLYVSYVLDNKKYFKVFSLNLKKASQIDIQDFFYQEKGVTYNYLLDIKNKKAIQLNLKTMKNVCLPLSFLEKSY